MQRRYIGQPVLRTEDIRLVQGKGLYVADVQRPGMVHVAFQRSPHAHARIVRVDKSAALAHPGVIAVLSDEDLGDENKPLYNIKAHPALIERMHLPLARGKVRYAGEPVAVVVAVDRYTAEDAAELIEVEYEPLPAVVDVRAALAPEAPLVHAELGNNIAANVKVAFGDYEAAKAAADLVVSDEFFMDRCSGSPMECRGVVAVWNPEDRETCMTVWAATQMPHEHRRAIAVMMGMPLEQIRFIAPDVGGGFGTKAPLYGEEYLIPLLAKKLGRPVKWIEDRREHFLMGTHGRGQYHKAELAVTRDGKILGIKDDFLQDNGAFTAWGVTKPILTAQGLIGPYKVPVLNAAFKLVFTTLPCTSPYRGAGRPQSTFVIERLMDLAARKLGLDPVEIRLRNFIQPDEFPYEFPMRGRDGKNLMYDSGDYPGNLKAVLEKFDLPAQQAEAKRLRAEGRLVGIGIGFGLEVSGLGPHEGALVRVDPATGKVFLYTGASSQGQGQETMLAQVCADVLGVPFEQVQVTMADTNRFPLGVGAIASRIGTVGSNAVAAAAQTLKNKVLEVAAFELEAAAEDLEMVDGQVGVRGAPSRTVSLQKLAWAASCPSPGSTHIAPYAPGLEAVEYFMPPGAAHASDAQAAMLEVNRETGAVKILKYACCNDSGTILNRMIIEGQIQGGIAAGIGNTLFERIVFDEHGQLLTGSYMDYLLATAMDIPQLDIVHMETRSPLNPLGVKGAGQAGTMPVPGVIAGAIDDALQGLGDVFVNRFPISPDQIWELIQGARKGGTVA